MNLARELTFKPSFMNEFYSLPHEVTASVWEKINYLVQDPFPDGRLKKKIKTYKDVYRIRSGDYRIFYCYGGNWVKLLAIRARKDAYREAAINFEKPIIPGNAGDIEIDEMLADGTGMRKNQWHPDNAVTSRTLPFIPDVEFLARLNIPAEFHDSLLVCRTEDDLLDVAVPAIYVERIIDNLFPRHLEEVISQPDFVLMDTRDLIRFKEGDLISFLLKLDPEQERLVDWALNGPSLIKGGPGTGKSTIALYRVRSLINYAREHKQPVPQILFTTYTPALIRFSSDLLQQLLGDQINQVAIKTADDLAFDIASDYTDIGDIVERDTLRAILLDALSHINSKDNKYLASLRPDYILDEIEWVIEGRNLKTLEEYLEADRTGRIVPLNPAARTALWSLSQEYDSILSHSNLWSMSRIRNRALELVISGQYSKRYDSVIIDEAQDLTPVSLKLLVELCANPRAIYITADASQCIYSRGFTWQKVHDLLKFRGRSLILKRNYRTTEEILRAATAFMEKTNSMDPESRTLFSVKNGVFPVLLGCASDAEQVAVTINFIRQMSRTCHLKTTTAAVLVPTSDFARYFAQELTVNGLPASYMDGSRLDLKQEVVKVLTINSSKGLEFPIVVLAGLIDYDFPGISDELSPEEIADKMDTARKQFFVAMTRAMCGLMVLYPEEHASRIINELDQTMWYTAQN